MYLRGLVILVQNGMKGNLLVISFEIPSEFLACEILFCFIFVGLLVVLGSESLGGAYEVYSFSLLVFICITAPK